MNKWSSGWWALPLRAVLGYGFVAHGAAKLARGAGAFGVVLHALGVPSAGAMAWITIAVEVLGGAALLAGSFVRLASVPLTSILVVAALTVHLPYGFSSIKLLAVHDGVPQFGPPGYEVVLLYIAGLAALVIGGAGPYSVDDGRNRRVRAAGEVLERVPPGGARAEFLPLMLLADDSAVQVRSYYQAGELFVLRGPGRVTRGIVLVVTDTGTRSVELKAVAVPAKLQGRGVGLRLLDLTLTELKADGVQRALVGTSTASVRELAFYQKAGFRPLRIERDFFNETRGYQTHLQENGIPVRDIIWMEREV